ncbi:lactate utilization protein [Caldicellulosiruptoraceae bacterium PP1]
MNQNKKWWIETNLNTLKNNLEKRNFDCFIIDKKEEVIDLIKDIVKEGSTVAVGGSMSLFEIGLIDFLRNGKYVFYDRYKEGLSPNEIADIHRKAFFTDYFFMSSNAITLDGKLINIDGAGNRLAALLYGPKNVIVIVGINKLVQNEEQGILRVRNIASPTNCKRLSKKTPCVVDGQCHDCLSDDCICSHIVVTRRHSEKGRIKVIVVKEELGF